MFLSICYFFRFLTIRTGSPPSLLPRFRSSKSMKSRNKNKTKVWYTGEEGDGDLYQFMTRIFFPVSSLVDKRFN